MTTREILIQQIFDSLLHEAKKSLKELEIFVKENNVFQPKEKTFEIGKIYNVKGCKMMYCGMYDKGFDLKYPVKSHKFLQLL